MQPEDREYIAVSALNNGLHFFIRDAGGVVGTTFAAVHSFVPFCSGERFGKQSLILLYVR